MLLQALQSQYVCPGETHPISRAVHLARLANYYAACRDCPFRHDPDSLVLASAEAAPSGDVPPAQDSPSSARRSVFENDGIRGVWRNDLTRSRAADFAAAFASLLWDVLPARTEDAPTESVRRPHGPLVVVGNDDRPSSPDVVTGVASALRLMGCQVVDVGLSSRPCFWFAVDHLNAAGGIHVTGCGRPPSWTGLDFVGRSGTPLSQESLSQESLSQESLSQEPSDATALKAALSLSDVERRLAEPFLRPARDSLPQRTFHAGIPYEAGLRKHFHALRPLTVCCGTPVPLIRETLERAFDSLPCRLKFVEIPQRARDVTDGSDDDVRRVGAAVGECKADLGVVMDDDGQRCGFLDERGESVDAETMARLLMRMQLGEYPRGAVVLPAVASADLRADVERHGGRIVTGGGTIQRTSDAVRSEDAVFGTGLDGRMWFRERFATCDAVITLAKVLELLSRSDRPFSEHVGGL